MQKTKKNKVLIYNDEGTGKLCILQTYDAIQKVCKKLRVSVRMEYVGHKDVLNTDDKWEDDTFLFVIPGGKDKPYFELLKGKGNRRIMNFVKNGGSYLGICAGAYYGAERIEFEKGKQRFN